MVITGTFRYYGNIQHLSCPAMRFIMILWLSADLRNWYPLLAWREDVTLLSVTTRFFECPSPNLTKPVAMGQNSPDYWLSGSKISHNVWPCMSIRVWGVEAMAKCGTLQVLGSEWPPFCWTPMGWGLCLTHGHDCMATKRVAKKGDWRSCWEGDCTGVAKPMEGDLLENIPRVPSVIWRTFTPHPTKTYPHMLML